MKVVVISDIHIFSAEDPLYGSLLALLRSPFDSGDFLVLGGDIFDFMVGRQEHYRNEYGDFFSTLSDLGARGVSVVYIEGNHDFHLSGLFREIPSVRIASSEVEISDGAKRLYVAHGDLVDREDRGYLALRAFFRSPLIRLAAFALPERVVEWIGTRSASSSRKIHPRLPEERGETNLTRLRSAYRGFSESKFREGFDAVVLGHCHDLDGAEFTAGSRRGGYMNVGFPRVHHSYVEWSEAQGLVRRPLQRFDH